VVNKVWKVIFDIKATLIFFTSEPEIHDLHQVLLYHKTEISTRLLTVPQTYRIQLQNLLDHLLTIDKGRYKINHRESYIFTNPMKNEDDTTSKLSRDVNHQQPLINNEGELFKNVDIDISIAEVQAG
jgi:hypothetical protein